jgi:hypothetical protein
MGRPSQEILTASGHLCSDLQQDSGDVLERGSGGDKSSSLVPIHVGSRHLIRVLEAKARKLERAPLNRQVIVAITPNYLGNRLKMDTHRSSLRPSPSGGAIGGDDGGGCEVDFAAVWVCAQVGSRHSMRL